tara:strand:+ start:407 stop:1606 length:1200 start_codon:yes stop_codon:yes gene_type:complete
MKILIITQYYPPEIGALSSRWGDYTDELLNLGHEVTILCQTPSYPKGFYYDGYKFSWVIKEKISSKLTIIRSASIANKRKTYLQKALHYFVFMFSGIINSLKIKNHDLVIVSSPPLFTAIIGIFLKKIKSVNYWLDLRDIWPESAVAIGLLKKNIFYSIGKKIELSVYNNAYGFIFPVPSFKSYLSSFPSLKEKPMLELVNGVSRELIEKANAVKQNKKNNFTVLYSGNLGYAQDLFTVIDAANQLKNHSLYFKIIGDGVYVQKLKDYAKNNNKITIIPSMSRDNLIKEIKNASICLVPLINSALFNKALPSKMFEYMACSKPVIVGISGDAKHLVESTMSGKVVAPEDKDELSKAILYYYNNPKMVKSDGKNGKNYVLNNLVKKNLIVECLKKIRNYN